LNECATIFGFVESSKNAGLIVSGNVAFSPTPPPLNAARLVITRHPDLSHTIFGSNANTFCSWFNCDQTFAPKIGFGSLKNIMI